MAILGYLRMLVVVSVCAISIEAEDTVSIKDTFLMEDFEDGDIQVTQVDGRSGIWHLDNDGSSGGVQTPLEGFIPIKGGPEGSTKCAHTTGSGFTEWGAELNVNLNTPDYPGIDTIVYQAYDASKYDGILFWAKGRGAIRVTFTILPIVPTYYGGICDDATQKCFDSHGKMFELNHPEEWHLYRVDFSEVVQNRWGLAADFDPSQILALQFFFGVNTTFDFAVDNISFYTKSKSE